MTKQSDHFDGKKFFMPTLQGSAVKKSLWQVFKWKFLENNKKTWQPFSGKNAVPQIAEQVPLNEMSTTYINHASHLIQLHQLNILTDPVFSQRVSPFTFIGPKRFRAPGLTMDALPKIDVIVISHNHYDHMDVASLKIICARDQPLIVVPLGNAKTLAGVKSSRIVELDWWESANVKPEQVITLVPSQHWSARSLWDANDALWGGFVIQAGGLKVYFSGDTGYGEHFKEIGEKFQGIDVSILPIGAYEPRWFMKEQHVNPEEAVLAHLDLGSKLSVASHHLTFQLTDEDVDEPVAALKLALSKYGMPENVFLTPVNGETVNYKPH